MPVVIHDETLDRTTDRTDEVKNGTFEELRNLNAVGRFPSSHTPEVMPSLEEIISRYKESLGFDLWR